MKRRFLFEIIEALSWRTVLERGFISRVNQISRASSALEIDISPRPTLVELQIRIEQLEF